MDNHPDFRNEKEWRRFMLEEMRGMKDEIKELRKEVGLFQINLTSLKITVGFISSSIAAVVSGAFAIGLKLIGKD